MSIKGALKGTGYGVVISIASLVLFAKYNTMSTTDFAPLGIALIILVSGPTIGLLVGSIV